MEVEVAVQCERLRVEEPDMVQPIGVQAAKQERPSWSGRNRQGPRNGTGLFGGPEPKIDQP